MGNPSGWKSESLSRVRLCTTLWTAAHQALLSMGCSRQGHWSGLPFPPPGDLPDPGIKPRSLMSPALASGLFTTGATWEALMSVWLMFFLGMTTSPETKFTTQK